MAASIKNLTKVQLPRPTTARAVLFSAVFLVVFILQYSLSGQILPAGTSDILSAVEKFLIAAALFSAAQQTAQARGAEEARLWWFWAAGMGLGFLGDVIWWYYDNQLMEPPFPSAADIFYLLMYLLALVGLLVFPAEKIHAEEKKFILLDNLVIMTGSGLVFWALLIAPELKGYSDLFTLLLGLIYPCLGLAVLWEIFFFFRNRKQQSAYLPMLLAGGGMLLSVVTDIFFLASFITVRVPMAVLESGWFAAGLVIGLAGVVQANYLTDRPARKPTSPLVEMLKRLESWPVYMPYLWVGLAYLILVVHIPSGQESYYLVVGIGLLIALVLLRQVLTIRENEALIARAHRELQERKVAQEALQQANLELDRRVEARTLDLQQANQHLSLSNSALENEVAVRKHAEQSVLRQMARNELVASISSGFINLPVKSIDAGIKEALRQIGEFVDADRSYIFQFSPCGDWMSNTYEWSRDAIEPQRERLQNVPSDSMVWLVGKLTNREAINLPNLDSILAEARADYDALAVQGIKSIAIIPLDWDRQLFGFIGFDAVRARREWSHEDLTLLRIVGEILMMAYQRKGSQEALTRYARRLQMLHDIDQAILAERPVEEIISNVLCTLDEMLPSRGAALVTTSLDAREAVCYVCRPGQALQVASLHEVDSPAAFAEVQAALKTLERGEPLQGSAIPTVLSRGLFPSGSLDTEETCLQVVPLSDQERTAGFLCMRLEPDQLAAEHTAGMREVAHSLAIALHQAQLRKELNRRLTWMETSLEEKELLLKEIHHRVKNNLQIISSLLSLQTQIISDEKARAALENSQLRVRSMALIHEKLYQSESLSHIELGPYIRSLAANLFHTYRQDAARVQLEIEIGDISAGVDSAVPIGLIMNELITNSLKYAFPGDRKGIIRISMQRQEDNWIRLTYTDNGVGLPEGYQVGAGKSLGMRLIYNLARQLDGEMTLTGCSGVCFELRFPGEDIQTSTGSIN